MERNAMSKQPKGILDKLQKDREKEVPEAEVKIVEEFLSNFIFDTNNKRQNQINLNLMLKAMPARVDELNCKRMPLFAFRIIQNSLIAYQNEDQDELFKFYDNRNKNRIRKLRNKAEGTSATGLRLNNSARSVLSSISRISETGSLRGQHNKRREERKEI